MILIRRPPVFSIHESRWVPEKVSLDEVDKAWSGLCADNPRYHDGAVLHVLGVVDLRLGEAVREACVGVAEAGLER